MVGRLADGGLRGATLHWANADFHRWPNLDTDDVPMLANVGQTHSSGTMALRRADEQNYVGPTPFCMILGQHAHTMGLCWPNIVMLSGFIRVLNNTKVIVP